MPQAKERSSNVFIFQHAPKETNSEARSAYRGGGCALLASGSCRPKGVRSDLLSGVSYETRRSPTLSGQTAMTLTSVSAHLPGREISPENWSLRMRMPTARSFTRHRVYRAPQRRAGDWYD